MFVRKDAKRWWQQGYGISSDGWTIKLMSFLPWSVSFDSQTKQLIVFPTWLCMAAAREEQELTVLSSLSWVSHKCRGKKTTSNAPSDLRTKAFISNNPPACDLTSTRKQRNLSTNPEFYGTEKHCRRSILLLWRMWSWTTFTTWHSTGLAYKILSTSTPKD